mmetsp:Transcript_24082/g.39582  ORF Transcript_24082/g.39582 Transcript_24082/m.39582 type:complete len:127 (-) Transcript_24082:570-950(-)
MGCFGDTPSSATTLLTIPHAMHVTKPNPTTPSIFLRLSFQELRNQAQHRAADVRKKVSQSVRHFRHADSCLLPLNPRKAAPLLCMLCYALLCCAVLCCESIALTLVQIGWGMFYSMFRFAKTSRKR